MAWRTKAADGPDLNGDARPEARTDAWQATQDRCLGQGEKTPLDVLLQFGPSYQDGRELASSSPIRRAAVCEPVIVTVCARAA
jgi:hypothetical protein